MGPRPFTAPLRYDETPKLDRQGLGLLLSVAVAAWIVEKDPFGVQDVQGKRVSVVKAPSWQSHARLLCLRTARLAALGSSALPGREAGPLGAQPLPQLLELAATKAADFTAFDIQASQEGSAARDLRRREATQDARALLPEARFRRDARRRR